MVKPSGQEKIESTPQKSERAPGKGGATWRDGTALRLTPQQRLLILDIWERSEATAGVQVSMHHR